MVKKQHTLLAEIMSGLQRSQIAHVKLREPPEPFDQSPGSVWLSYEIRADSGLAYVRGFWQAQIVSGLFADISRELGLPRLYGHSFAMIRPGGERTEDGASVIVRPFEGPTEEASEASLRSLIAEYAGILGIPVPSVETAAPLGHLMVEVIWTVDDPAIFLKDELISISDVVAPINGWEGRPRAEGAYAEVRDSAGRAVMASAYAVKTGESCRAVSRDVEATTRTLWSSAIDASVVD